MKLFNEYRGLKKEIYILFWGRVVTNMGALIWPLMTMILKNKLGMSASAIAMYFLVVSIFQLPVSLIGGKLADHFNKKHIIVVADSVTILCYFVSAIVPLSQWIIILLFIGSIAATMEWPAYDALVADLTSADERSKAYSLSYLGGNLGLILAPTIGGLLFKEHLNLCFLISSLSTLSSTILIAIFIKDLKRNISEEETNVYEEASSGSALSILWKSKTVLKYILLACIFSFVYSMFNYLIPLNMEAVYGADGAAMFGTMTSVNAIIVIVFTPFVTGRFAEVNDLKKYRIGQIFILLGLGMFIFIQEHMILAYLAMVIFTIGEVFETIGSQPYMSKRIPSTHRGRISSLSGVMSIVICSLLQVVTGVLVDTYDYVFVWSVIVGIGCIAVILLLFVEREDKKVYPLLYKKNSTVS